MRAFWQFSFWVSITLIFYVYFIYPLLLWVINQLKVNRIKVSIKKNYEPKVSIIIAAYNEERVIAQKLRNVIALDYPKDKIEIIVASDGSTDKTEEIVKRYANVKLVSHPQNRGKTIIQNEAVAQACNGILVFSDATGMYEKNSIRRLVQHFRCEKVGCVTGMVIDATKQITSVTSANNVYFVYEFFLRKMESKIGILAMASGSIFAVRRSLYQSLPYYVSDDFVTPFNIIEKGYRVIFEPEAISWDEIANSVKGKFSQKVRVVTLDLPGLFYKRALLNPFRYPFVAWGLVSHKLLRWLVPVFLILLLGTNFFLLNNPFFWLTLGCQIVFYLFAFIGWRFQIMGNKVKLFYIPFYFCLLNISALIGLINFILGVRSGSWVPER